MPRIGDENPEDSTQVWTQIAAASQCGFRWEGWLPKDEKACGDVIQQMMAVHRVRCEPCRKEQLREAARVSQRGIIDPENIKAVHQLLGRQVASARASLGLPELNSEEAGQVGQMLCDDRFPLLILAGTPWPGGDVIRRLMDATAHLLDDHGCDRLGHEGTRYALEVARKAWPA